MKRSWDDSYDNYSGSYQDYSQDRRSYSAYSKDDDYYADFSHPRGSSHYGGSGASSAYYDRSSSSSRGRGRERSSTTYVNPEYYDNEYGKHFEGTSASAVDPHDDISVKRRKVDNLSLCVDFVRGNCTRGSRCPKPHVDYVESIDEREVIAKVKFCHNFQNKGVCLRPQGCNFLHVTRREEDEFLLTGVIPQTVFERTSDQGGFRGGRDDDDGRDGYRSRGGRGGYDSRSMRGGRDGGRGGGRGGCGGRGGDRGRGGGRGRGHSGHSCSQPVTFMSYCVDFLKGTCSKGQSCVLKHVEYVENEDDRAGIVKDVFCHDFLNNRCRRPSCKYVHATRDEEEFFLANGYFAPAVNARNRDKMFYSNVCLDFLRNQCIRGNKCNFKHVSFVEDENERKVLSRSIFCHDFQDGACTRPTCKLLHSSIQNEIYFLHNGKLPAQLSVTSSGPHARDSGLDKLAKDVCRDFIKNRCVYGDNCRFYHPTSDQVQALVANSNASTKDQWDNPDPGPSSAPQNPPAAAQGETPSDNEALQGRVKQLERLLADACYCMTLAVGDQNPAISTLMKTISGLAPSSALANQDVKEEEQTPLPQQQQQQQTPLPPQSQPVATSQPNVPGSA